MSLRFLYNEYLKGLGISIFLLPLCPFGIYIFCRLYFYILFSICLYPHLRIYRLIIQLLYLCYCSIYAFISSSNYLFICLFVYLYIKFLNLSSISTLSLVDIFQSRVNTVWLCRKRIPTMLCSSYFQWDVITSSWITSISWTSINKEQHLIFMWRTVTSNGHMNRTNWCETTGTSKRLLWTNIGGVL